MSTEIAGREVYTPTDVAKGTGLKRAYVMDLIRKKKLIAGRVGKFYLITQSSLKAFLANCQENGTGKNAISEGRMAKLRFNAGLRVIANGPEQIECFDTDIQDLKGTIPECDPIVRVPKIAKLKSVVETREAKKQKLENMPALLNQLSETAYPGMMELAEADPDALEVQFIDEANEALNAQDHEQVADPMNQYHKDSLGTNVPAAQKATVKAKTAASE